MPARKESPKSHINTKTTHFTKRNLMQIKTSQDNRAFRALEKIIYYCKTNFYYLREDKSFFLMKYLARFCLVRDCSRIGVKRLSLPPIQSGTFAIELDHPLSEVTDCLESDGYYSGLRLNQAQINAVLDFAYSHPCYANRDSGYKITVKSPNPKDLGINVGIKYASYLHSQDMCEVIQVLKRDPIILSIAHQYLGRSPVYMHSDLLWSFPRPLKDVEKLAAAQVFHCDINDYRSLKFFFYLTDVSQQDGAHLYIKGTHRHRRLRDQLLGQRLASKADQNIIQTYGESNIVTITGPAGLGFVGDPYCIHRGSNVGGTRNRLLLQLEFGLYTYKTYYKHKVLKVA